MTELQYISVTGNTWFVLDHKFTSNESVEIENVTFNKADSQASTKHQQLIAGGGGEWTRIGMGGRLYYSYYGDNKVYFDSITGLTNQKLLMTNEGFWVDGVQITAKTFTDVVTQSTYMVLFANTSSGNDKISNQTASTGKITIKDSGNTIVAQYVPYLDDNDVVCFYNTVSDSYIYKSGTGTPIAGPVAHTFNVNPSSLNFTAAGGSENVTINAETGWTCTTIPTGFTLSTTAGTSGQTTITVTAPSYTGSTNKSETAVFTDDDNFTLNFPLSQKKFMANYTFCAKVNNNGEAWIDTGIYPDSATTIELYLVNDNSTANTGYYPKYVGNSGLRFTKYSGDGTRFYFEYGDGHSSGSFPIGTEAKITLENTGITIDNGEGSPTIGRITLTSFTATGDTIHIGDENCKASFGRCIIKKGGNVVGDFMPCVYGTEAGFYDNVSQTFKGNSGSGTGFTAIDEYGNILFSTDPVDALMIGSEVVKICYLGERPIYAPAPFIGFQMTSTANLGTDSGSTDTIRIKSSENWTLSIPNDCTWLSASTLSGAAGTSNVTLTATETNTAQTRTVTITATTANYSATCVVTQYYVQYVEWIRTETAAWNQNNIIRTSITATTGTTMRVKYIGEGIGSDRLVGYCQYDTNNKQFRYFNIYNNSNYVDLNASRKNGGSPAKESGVEYDLTLGNNYLYDNTNSAYIVAQSNVQSTLDGPSEILVDVGSQKIKELIIQQDGVTVFYGKAAVYGGNVGLYDSITNTLKYNSALTMTYQAITPPQPTGETGTLSISVGDSIEELFDEGWEGGYGTHYTVTLSGASSGVAGIAFYAISDMDYNSFYSENPNPDSLQWFIDNAFYETGETSITDVLLADGDLIDGFTIDFTYIKAFAFDTNGDLIESISAITEDIHLTREGDGDEPEEGEPCGCCQGTGVSSEWDEEEQTYIDVECPCCGGTGIDPGGGDEPEGEPVE